MTQSKLNTPVETPDHFSFLAFGWNTKKARELIVNRAGERDIHINVEKTYQEWLHVEREVVERDGHTYERISGGIVGIDEEYAESDECLEKLTAPVIVVRIYGDPMLIWGWEHIWRAHQEGIGFLTGYTLTAAEERECRTSGELPTERYGVDFEWLKENLSRENSRLRVCIDSDLPDTLMLWALDHDNNKIPMDQYDNKVYFLEITIYDRDQEKRALKLVDDFVTEESDEVMDRLFNVLEKGGL